MSLFISDAFAASDAMSAQGSLSSSLLLLAVFVLFIYFFVWRPQSKRVKAHQSMVDSLQIGNEVITNGGLLGEVVQMDNSIVHVALAENIVVKLQKSAVSHILPKGTIK
jgi:preprotein translocase subunit YajC